jgi:hypothetical protein
MFNWFRMKAEGGNPKPVGKAAEKPVTKPVVPRKLWEVLSVERGKGSDQIVTVGIKDGGVFDQYVHRGYADWYLLPTLKKINHHDLDLEDKLKEFYVRQAYADLTTETRISLVMKSRPGQQTIKCLFCHSEMSDKAQVCLSCGGMLCLLCAGSITACPTLGCKK